MKYLYLLFISLILVACSNNNEVYWCGDHACINKKERRIYFAENMIVEVREKNKNSKLNKKEKDAILKEIKLKDKKYAKKVKKNNDDFYLKEDELIIKEIKNNKSKKKEITTKEIKQKNDEVILEENEKAIKEIEKEIEEAIEEKNEEVIAKKEKQELLEAVSNKSGISAFNDLANKISKRNKEKDYPDINNIEINNE